MVGDMAKVIAVAFLLAHLFGSAGWSNAETPDGASYGTKVKFSAGRTLHFPDFDLAYMGKRHVTPPQYPRGWWIHDFKVRGKGGEQTVSWSAGTGDIGPTRFKVNGVDFQVELSHSDKLGSLREGEMVVSPVALRSAGTDAVRRHQCERHHKAQAIPTSIARSLAVCAARDDK